MPAPAPCRKPRRRLTLPESQSRLGRVRVLERYKNVRARRGEEERDGRSVEGGPAASDGRRAAAGAPEPPQAPGAQPRRGRGALAAGHRRGVRRLRRRRLELGGLHAAGEQRGARDDGRRRIERGARDVGRRLDERLGAGAHGVHGRGRDHRRGRGAQDRGHAPARRLRRRRHGVPGPARHRQRARPGARAQHLRPAVADHGGPADREHARGVHRGQRRRDGLAGQAQGRHHVLGRQAADRGRRPLVVQAHRARREAAVLLEPRHVRPEGGQEGRRPDHRVPARAALRRHAAAHGQPLPLDRPGRHGRLQGSGQGHRHRPLHGRGVHAGRAHDARAQRQLLARRHALRRPGRPHLHRPRGAAQRAPLAGRSTPSRGSTRRSAASRSRRARSRSS